MNNILKQKQRAFRELSLKIENNFPFESKSQLFEFYKRFQNYYKKLFNLPENDRYFFLHLEKFLASFKNSHTRIGSYPSKVFFRPNNYQVILVENKFLLKKSNKILGKILEIDNKTPKSILKKNVERISSSTKQYSIRQALNFLLSAWTNRSVNIKLRIGKKIKYLKIKRGKIKSKPIEKIVEHKILKNNIGYIKIRSWANENLLLQKLENILSLFIKRNIKFLILDVRGNGGGDSRIAQKFSSHFFNKKVLFSITKKRVLKSDIKLRKYLSFVKPKKPYLKIPIAILIDSACFSSNEYFIAGMKDNKRALLIGETTGGGSGNPKKFIIPYKNLSFELFISSWIYYRPNGKPLEGLGVKPDIILRPTLNDTKLMKDIVFKKAITKASRML